jgi:hypothetical protein
VRRQLWVTLILFFSIPILFGQSISLTILNKSNLNPVENAEVIYKQSSALTDTNGQVTLNKVRFGDSILVFSIGFYRISHIVSKPQDTIYLSPSTTLDDITIVAARDVKEFISINSITINPAKLDRVPTLLGEKDLLKVYQIMPGVLPSVEGTNGLNIRGGSADQNLILVDGAPVYNPSHLFGLFSSFIPETVESAQLIKGAFPAQFAGRLSSVIDIKTKGKIDSTYGHVSLGLISSKAVYQQMIQNSKTHINVGYRRTYADQVVKGLNTIGVFSPPISQFYNFRDMTVNVLQELGGQSTLSFNILNTRDKFSLAFKGKPGEDWSSDYGVSWSNAAYSTHFTQGFGDSYKLKVSAIYSGYNLRFDQTVTSRVIDKVSYASQINESSLKADFTGNYHNLSFVLGGQLTNMGFSPGTYEVSRIVQNIPPTALTVAQADISNLQGNLYQNLKLNFSKNAFLNLGLNTLLFNIDNDLLLYPQPRVDFNFSFFGLASSLAYARMAQTIHLLSYEGLGLPADVWLPSNDGLRPATSDQFSLGFSKRLKNFDIEVSGFYKKMAGTITYKDGESFWNTSDFYSRVTLADGDAKGFEMSMGYNYAKGSTRLSYTLSKSDRWSPDIANGARFPFRFDRRHFFNVYSDIELSKKWLFSGLLVMGSGLPTTVPVQKYFLTLDKGTYTNTELYYGSRNNYRMRNYYRMDANLIYQRGNKQLSFGAYNLINYKNVIFISADKDKATEVSFLGAIPYINYSISF